MSYEYKEVNEYKRIRGKFGESLRSGLNFFQNQFCAIISLVNLG